MKEKNDLIISTSNRAIIEHQQKVFNDQIMKRKKLRRINYIVENRNIAGNTKK